MSDAVALFELAQRRQISRRELALQRRRYRELAHLHEPLGDLERRRDQLVLAPTGVWKFEMGIDVPLGPVAGFLELVVNAILDVQQPLSIRDPNNPRIPIRKARRRHRQSESSGALLVRPWRTA